jgi:hypothetical protein
MRSNTRSAYPPTANGWIEPSASLVCPLAHRLALSPSLPRVGATTTSAHGALAPGGFCWPPHHRDYAPIRQSRRLPRTSQVRWLDRGSVPDDLVWAAAETFPALDQRSFPPCPPPYADRRNRDTPATSPLPEAFRTNTVRQLLQPPTPSSGWGFAYDAAGFASCYGPQGGLPSWTGLTGSSPPAAEDVYPRACPRSVTRPPSQV